MKKGHRWTKQVEQPDSKI